MEWEEPFALRDVGGYSYAIVSQDDPAYDSLRTPDAAIDLDASITGLTTAPLEPGHTWEVNVRTVDAGGLAGEFYSSFWVTIESCSVHITRPRAGDSFEARDWVTVYWAPVTYDGNDVGGAYDVGSIDLLAEGELVATVVSNQPNILWAGFRMPDVDPGAYQLRITLDRNASGDPFPSMTTTGFPTRSRRS